MHVSLYGNTLLGELYFWIVLLLVDLIIKGSITWNILPTFLDDWKYLLTSSNWKYLLNLIKCQILKRDSNPNLMAPENNWSDICTAGPLYGTRVKDS